MTISKYSTLKLILINLNNRSLFRQQTLIRVLFLFVTLFSGELVYSAPPGTGTTVYWTGKKSTDWNDKQNWSTNKVPSDGDIISIGNGNAFTSTNQPAINNVIPGTPASITIGSTQAVTISINSGGALNVGSITMSTGTYNSSIIVNGILNVGPITMNSTLLNSITLNSGSTMRLSGNISGGTFNASNANTKLIMNGTAMQSIPGATTLTNGTINYLDVANTFNGGTGNRGVLLTTATTVNRLTIEANAIYNANGSMVAGSGYYSTIRKNATFISRSYYTFFPLDSIDATGTMEFTAQNQGITLCSTVTAVNSCPNVVFTGNPINITGSGSNSNFLVRGNLNITATTSSVIYSNITQININGDFSGTNALNCGSIPVNIGGSWTNSDNDNITGIVTYNGTNAANTQIVATNVIYGNNLVFTGASPKQVASGTLEVDGSTLDNSAGSSVDFVTNKTTTFLNGTGPQAIKSGTATNSICTPDIVTGTVFYNLKISNGANTTTLSGNNNIAPNGVLTLADANSTLDASASGTTFTLMSSAAGTASVAALPTGATITGSSINVQRYFKAQSTPGTVADYTRNYRLLSLPVNVNGVINNTGATAYSTLSYLSAKSGLLTGVFTGGPGGTANGFTVTNATPTVYLYKESLTASNKGFNTGNFKGITNMTGNPLTVYNDAGTTANVSATLYAGNGFMLYYVGNNVTNTVQPTPAPPGTHNKSTRTGGVYGAVDASTSTAIGTLNQGSIPVKIWWSGINTLGNVKTGYNLVGNPYASSIDWDTFSTSNSAAGIYGPNISSTIYVFNYATRNYGIYQAGTSGGSGTNNASHLIASGQGFFVQVKNATGSTLTFNEAAKTSSQPTGTPLLMAAHPALASASTSAMQIMRLKLAADSIDTDETMLIFSPDNSNAYEPYTDAARMEGIGNTVSLASYAQGSTVPLSINHMGAIAADSRFKLYVNVTGSSGVDTLIATGLSSLDSRYDVYLLDHYKKDSLWLSQYPRYLFNINPSDTTSFGSNRFEVVFHKKAEYSNFHLLSFSGSPVAGNALLAWKTDHEGTYTSFALQRKDNAGQYTTLTQVQGNGLGSYSYTDQTAAQGANLYRLQITDAYGTVSYSSEVSVTLSGSTGLAASANSEGVLVSVYPNPAASNIQVSVAEQQRQELLTAATTESAASSGALQVSILSMNGQVVSRFVGASTTAASGDISGLRPGTYILEASDSQGKKVYGRKRFVKL